MRLAKHLTICLFCLTLAGCGLIPVHQVQIQQGNAISQKMVSQLHPGMSKKQVKDVLGTPMLVNTFSDHTFNYVYTYQSGHTKIAEKRLTLNFNNIGLLQNFDASGVQHSDILRTKYYRHWY